MRARAFYRVQYDRWDYSREKIAEGSIGRVRRIGMIYDRWDYSQKKVADVVDRRSEACIGMINDQWDYSQTSCGRFNRLGEAYRGMIYGWRDY